MEIGDIVAGKENSPYTITNHEMRRGVVTKIGGDKITVKIIDHEKGETGAYIVDCTQFDVIGHVKPFDAREAADIISKKRWGDLLLMDLSRANLSRANLSGADLRGADLSSANLRGADLSSANLRGADLSWADLSSANLSGANLRGADLSRANLSLADLSSANLSVANLSGADLRGADLSSANLSVADLSSANLSVANLSGADLSSANLRGADLSGAAGLIEPSEYMTRNFEKTEKGYIVYKVFGGEYPPACNWAAEPDSILCETVNPYRTENCGCGINVAPLEWVKSHYTGDVWECLIEWEWLPSVVVPYNTDGKIRCGKVRLMHIVEGDVKDE